MNTKCVGRILAIVFMALVLPCLVSAACLPVPIVDTGWHSIFDRGVPTRQSQMLLGRALENWNRYYQYNVRAVDYKYLGVVCCGQMSKAIDIFTEPENVWVPYGDYSQRESIIALNLERDRFWDRETYFDWSSEIAGKIKPGLHVYEVHWLYGDFRFKTFCITDDENLIYDPMLFNAPIFTFSSDKRFISVGIWRLWAEPFSQYDKWKLGEISVNISGKCCPSHCPQHCYVSSSSSAESGKAMILTDNDFVIQRKCKLKYNWAYVCDYNEIFKQGWTGLDIMRSVGIFGYGKGSIDVSKWEMDGTGRCGKARKIVRRVYRVQTGSEITQ